MSGPKVYVDWGKLIQVILILASTVVLGVMEVIDSETVAAVIGLGAGYVFGNGKSVREGNPPAPLIGRRPVDDQTWTLETPPPAPGTEVP